VEYFDVGQIVNTHGVRGLVRVISHSDDPERFFKLKRVILDDGKNTELEIEQASFHKQFILLKFKGMDDMNAALAVKGKLLKVPESEGLKLDEDEYYLKDIYDMEVFDDDGNFLGIISDIIFTGANDVYVVKKEGIKDLLLPAIKQCILDVDVAAKRMLVHVPEGLRD